MSYPRPQHTAPIRVDSRKANVHCTQWVATTEEAESLIAELTRQGWEVL